MPENYFCSEIARTELGYLSVNMRTDLVRQPNRWYLTSSWGFENIISLEQPCDRSFMTLVSVYARTGHH